MKFEQLLRDLKIPFKQAGEDHHCRPGWIQLECPFCGKGSGKSHLGYCIAGAFLNCWKCGRHRLGDTISALTGLNLKKSIELVKGLSKEKGGIAPVRGSLVLPRGLSCLLTCHLEYLRRRGFKPHDLERLWGIQGLGLVSQHPKNLSWRIFIPIHYQGEVVSWTTRSISDEVNLRYISASADQEAIKHKSLLYGEDYCYKDTIIIVEGPTDVWAIGPGSVATCGTGWSRSQLLRMSKYHTKVVCFDNEPEAQKRAQSLCDLLEPLPGEVVNVVLSGKDAASSKQSEIDKLRSQFLD